jgi:hypothetical protein
MVNIKIKGVARFSILILFLFVAQFSVLKTLVLAQDSIRVGARNVEYELNFMISYGGDSKLALLLPKINVSRKHNIKSLKPYYGGGLGLHGALVTWYATATAYAGLEKGHFNFETSLTHFRNGKSRPSDTLTIGPFAQNLASLKLGILIKKVRVQFVRSFILSERIPAGQEKNGLMDIGKIGNAIWGIEVQFVEFLNKKL